MGAIIVLQLQITKVGLLKLLQKLPETQDVFFTLSDVDIIIEGDVKTSVKIAYGIYTTKSTASVDELRLDLLMRKYKTTSVKNLSYKVKKIDASSMPACTHFLALKMKRFN